MYVPITVGLLSGFISLNIPVFLQYVSFISPMTWGSYILANVVFDNQEFTCDSDEKNAAGDCPISTGDQVLSLYGMTGRDGQYGLTFHLWIIGLNTAIYFLAAYTVLRLRGYNLSH
jgi:hypothetical protein